MKKSSRFIKRRLALVVVLLLSIESFAAVVGDNDGAAFITKAEFDSMKNDFQSQLDRYNSSLDNKIDGAIATYLAGAKVTSQMTILPQVSNYEEIMWINDWYFYGKWRKFSDRTTYTGSDTNVWYKPDLSSNRINFLADKLYFYDSVNQGYGYLVYTLGFNIRDVGPNVAVCNAIGGTAAAARALTFTAVYMRKDEAGWYIYGVPVVNLAANVTWNDIRTHSPLCDPGLYGYRTANTYVGSVESAVPTGNELYSLTFNMYRMSSGNKLGWVTSKPDGAINGVPKQYMWDTVDTGNHINWVSVACHADWWHADKRYFQSGSQVQTGDFSGDLHPDIYYSMTKGLFGTDNNTKATLAKYDADSSISNLYQIDYTGSTETTWVTGTWSEVKLSNLSQGGRTDAPPTPLNLNGRLQLPLLPQDFLKNLSSHLYKFKSTYLKLGDGLPISDGFDADGYCQISFDFETKEMLNLTQKDYKIYIDAKNKNFNDTSGSYLRGYGDLVDPNNTTVTEKSMQRFVCDASTGKAKLTIPVKKGEELWLRIAPYSDEKGRFAYMKNLKCTYFR